MSSSSSTVRCGSKPDLATEVLGEVAPVYDRWSKGDKKGSEVGEEPALVEMVTVSLQNNHLLRGMIKRLIDMETMKEVAKVYMTNLKREGKMVERVHSASMLVKLVGLSVMQGELEWRGEMLEALASVSVVGGVLGVGVLNSSGRDQMKDVLFRALDSRNKNLEDSVALLVGLVKYIREQLNKAATRVKALDDEQDAVAKKALGVIDKLEKKWGKGKGKEVGVFLLLYFLSDVAPDVFPARTGHGDAGGAGPCVRQVFQGGQEGV